MKKLFLLLVLLMLAVIAPFHLNAMDFREDEKGNGPSSGNDTQIDEASNKNINQEGRENSYISSDDDSGQSSIEGAITDKTKKKTKSMNVSNNLDSSTSRSSESGAGGGPSTPRAEMNGRVIQQVDHSSSSSALPPHLDYSSSLSSGYRQESHPLAGIAEEKKQAYLKARTQEEQNRAFDDITGESSSSSASNPMLVDQQKLVRDHLDGMIAKNEETAWKDVDELSELSRFNSSRGSTSSSSASAESSPVSIFNPIENVLVMSPEKIDEKIAELQILVDVQTDRQANLIQEFRNKGIQLQRPRENISITQNLPFEQAFKDASPDQQNEFFLSSITLEHICKSRAFCLTAINYLNKIKGTEEQSVSKIYYQNIANECELAAKAADQEGSLSGILPKDNLSLIYEMAVSNLAINISSHVPRDRHFEAGSCYIPTQKMILSDLARVFQRHMRIPNIGFIIKSKIAALHCLNEASLARIQAIEGYNWKEEPSLRFVQQEFSRSYNIDKGTINGEELDPALPRSIRQLHAFIKAAWFFDRAGLVARFSDSENARIDTFTLSADGLKQAPMNRSWLPDEKRNELLLRAGEALQEAERFKEFFIFK